MVRRNPPEEEIPEGREETNHMEGWGTVFQAMCVSVCVCLYVCLFILEEEQGVGVVFPNSQQILIFGMQKQESRTSRSSPNFVILKILPTFFIFFTHYHAI